MGDKDKNEVVGGDGSVAAVSGGKSCGRVEGVDGGAWECGVGGEEDDWRCGDCVCGWEVWGWGGGVAGRVAVSGIGVIDGLGREFVVFIFMFWTLFGILVLESLSGFVVSYRVLFNE